MDYIGLTRTANRTARHEAELGFRLARRSWGKGYEKLGMPCLRTVAFGGYDYPDHLYILNKPGS